MEYLLDYQRDAKIRHINRTLSACKLIPNRPDILALWGAESFDDMTDANLVACQAFVDEAYRGRTTKPTDEVRKLRSQVLALLNKLGKYAEPNDWSQVNRYLLQKKICGKLLYMLTASELEALVRKLRAIRDKKDDAGDEYPHSPRSARKRPEYTCVGDLDGPQRQTSSVDHYLKEAGLFSMLLQTTGPAN